ncbi:MAG: ribonuclease H-like domain-containing protein, partial [Anaerolineae bacterium]|nr:ribonuclease H-like domain-containing protein [Anaerolineae bacterium]
MSDTADDLRKRLERLGVRLGAGGLQTQLERAQPIAPRPAPPRHRIEDWVPGVEVETEEGACFLSETRYPREHRHGQMPVGAVLEHRPSALRLLLGEADSFETDFHGLAFLDTETTGLAGGTGTYAFLVGVGRFEEDEFVVRQYFMRDIPEEPAMLALVRRVLSDCRGLVTFNGRVFDWPLLETRFAMNRQPPPLVNAYHLDLLVPARRLWRRRLKSCALSSLEEHVLCVQRSGNDVPGWAIPGLYRDFLQWGRAEPMRQVFYHNAHDILSLATLAAWLCATLSEPLHALSHGEDLLSLAQRREVDGDLASATELYERCLRCQLAPEERHAAMHRLARLYRRAGRAEDAVALWHALAEERDVEACIALAKYYEHTVRDLARARTLTTRALALLGQQPRPDRRRLAEAERRLGRLADKSSR